MSGAHAHLLPDGKRLHLQYGPIDLIIEAFGGMDEVRLAYAQAAASFGDVLATLVGELALLKTPLGVARPEPAGPVARRMVAACWPYREDFITPMAAVAGAVADHVLAAMVAGRTLQRAYVNDGGDIAFYLAPGEQFRCGLVADVAEPAIDGAVSLDSAMPVRGIATSGRATKGSGGRSFSLGIADAVTVLAHDAAAADAAATVIANAVDLPGHPAIVRAPASSIDPDSDLGDLAVTMEVGALSAVEIGTALKAGVATAERLRHAGLVYGAVLVLRRHYATVGTGLRRLAAA